MQNPSGNFFVLSSEPPRWKKKPQSAVYSTGSSGILLCEAEGEPQPTIKWRLNGLPIESELKTT
jgi:neuropilin 2